MIFPHFACACLLACLLLACSLAAKPVRSSQPLWGGFTCNHSNGHVAQQVVSGRGSSMWSGILHRRLRDSQHWRPPPPRPHSVPPLRPAGPGADHRCDPACPPPTGPCAADTHRHGGISLSPAPWQGSGVVSSVGGCETRQPKWDPVEPVRYGHAGSGALPLARAGTEPNPTPHSAAESEHNITNTVSYKGGPNFSKISALRSCPHSHQWPTRYVSCANAPAKGKRPDRRAHHHPSA